VTVRQGGDDAIAEHVALGSAITLSVTVDRNEHSSKPCASLSTNRGR
jgi:hypothetical protein